jgi:inosine triphosphate pyrophosphatase
MPLPLFITGNPDKAAYLSRLLHIPLEHRALDIPEIQSLDAHEVVQHKVRAAYARVGVPVLVEDVSLEFDALEGLPGTFVKHFIDSLGLDGICRLLDGRARTGTARCVFGYTDGVHEHYFEGSARVVIAENPRGDNGYGWDQIVVHDGYTQTRAELDREENERLYLTIKPIEQVSLFLSTLS